VRAGCVGKLGIAFLTRGIGNIHVVRAAMMLMLVRLFRKLGDLAASDRSGIGNDGEGQRADGKHCKPESWIAKHGSSPSWNV
jgi:hypothetical protein